MQNASSYPDRQRRKAYYSPHLLQWCISRKNKTLKSRIGVVVSTRYVLITTQLKTIATRKFYTELNQKLDFIVYKNVGISSLQYPDFPPQIIPFDTLWRSCSWWEWLKLLLFRHFQMLVLQNFTSGELFTNKKETIMIWQKKTLGSCLRK